VDWDFLPNPNHFIKFGIGGTYHQFIPGNFDLKFKESDNQTNIDTTIGQKELFAFESAIYLEDDYRISKKLKANIGLHGSLFSVSGKNYYSIQPRLGLRYLLPYDFALKASYAEMQQYIHLLAFEGIGLPTDQWVPTTDNVKPQRSQQFALGIAKTFSREYEVSLEGYYKKMENVIAYKEGANLFQFNDWQERVTQGKGESYGAELFFQKKTGNLTGWVGYTLSWSNRQFEELNGGKMYPYRYDRRHDLSIVASYKLSDRVSMSGTWVYGTGNAVTLAGTKYHSTHPLGLGGTVVASDVDHYSDKNNFRMASYHRLDFGLDFTKKKESYIRKWSIGAYNGYNRKNPFFLYYDSFYVSDGQGGGEEKTKLKQVSLFPVIPYVKWSLDF
jgi:hypothetical protein